MSLEELYLRSPVWAQNILFNAQALRIHLHRYGRRHREELTKLLQRERWSREQLRDFQNHRLRHVIQQAHQRSPFYQRVFRTAGVAPDDIKSVEDIGKLPLLTKADVRAHGKDMLTAPGPQRGWLHGHTSGTTGSPLSLWYDRASCVINNAVDSRHKNWVGIPDGAWIGFFLGRVIVPPEQRKPPFWRANRIHHQVWFSSFHMSDDWLATYVQEIKARGLRFLEGYPSTLYILAQYLQRRQMTLPMEAVITSSETLLDLQRDMIEQAFQCRLFDFYALAERVLYAGECEAHDGKHLADDFGYVEVVDDNGSPVPPGELGYLVGTSLHNVAMPMIRYRTNDVSAIVEEPCSCGRTLLRLRDVATKAEDIVVTPDGRMISPSILTHPFKPFDQIIKSQVVQEEIDRVLVKVVPSSEFTDEHRQSLIASLQLRLGSEMTIEVESVADIPRTDAGKFRWVVSHVEHTCALDWEDTSTTPRASGGK